MGHISSYMHVDVVRNNVTIKMELIKLIWALELV